MCGSDSGHMGVWGAHEGVSWSKTIILSRHVFFEKSAIFDFFAILGRPKNRFFPKYQKCIKSLNNIKYYLKTLSMVLEDVF